MCLAAPCKTTNLSSNCTRAKQTNPNAIKNQNENFNLLYTYSLWFIFNCACITFQLFRQCLVFLLHNFTTSISGFEFLELPLFSADRKMKGVGSFENLSQALTTSSCQNFCQLSLQSNLASFETILVVKCPRLTTQSLEKGNSLVCW